MDASPFRFEGPVEPDDLIGREAETDAVAGYARAGRAMSIAAPRRYGKTSLLRSVAAQLQEQDHVVATVDLLGLAGPADFATRYATAWRRATPTDGRAARRPGPAAPGRPSGARGARRVPGPARGLAERGGGAARTRPASARPGVLRLRRQPAAPARGGVRRQRAGLRQPGSQGPSWSTCRPRACRCLHAHFLSTDRDPGTTLTPLFALADGHPQRAMFLAHLLWEQVPRGGQATDSHWTAALLAARTWVAEEMTGAWTGLSRHQQRALVAIAGHGSATLASVQVDGVPRSALQTAQASLVRRGLVEPDTQRAGPRGGTRYRLVDPLLADWALRRRR